MAAITRLHLLHHSSPTTLKPSLLLTKCPHSPSHSFNTNLGRRKFSATPLCSSSVSTHQVSIFACACVSACFLCLKLNSFGAFSEFVFGGWIERVYSGGSSELSQWVLDSLSCYGYKRIFLCILFYILWLHFSWFLMNLFDSIISLCLLSENLIENSRNMFLKVDGSVELLIYNV